jgi:hypothetical protein
VVRKQRARRAVSHDPAAGLDDDDPIHDRQPLADAVLDDDQRRAEPVDRLPDHGPDLRGGVWIQVGGRLIEQEEAGREGQGRRERQPLLLAAGKRVGRAVAAVWEVDGRQRGVDPPPDGVGRNASVLEAKGDLVAGAGHHDLRLGILEEEPAPISGKAWLESVDEQRPLRLDRRRIVEPGDGGQERRLAGAGWAEEKDALARLDDQVDLAEGPRTAPGLADPPSARDDRGRRAASRHGSPHITPSFRRDAGRDPPRTRAAPRSSPVPEGAATPQRRRPLRR